MIRIKILNLSSIHDNIIYRGQTFSFHVQRADIFFSWIEGRHFFFNGWSQDIFFTHGQGQNIFFGQNQGQNIFFKKNPGPPPWESNGRSLIGGLNSRFVWKLGGGDCFGWPMGRSKQTFRQFVKAYKRFDIMTSSLTSWRTFLSNDEPFVIMTCVDIMTNFITSWLVYDMTNFGCDKVLAL